MSKYFMETKIFWQGKELPPRKVKLAYVSQEIHNGKVRCVDYEDNIYVLPITEIKEEEEK